MSALTAIWRDNPVLTKELRVRMRGARAYWVLTGYLLFLSFILFFRYMFWWNEAQREGAGFSSGINRAMGWRWEVTRISFPLFTASR